VEKSRPVALSRTGTIWLMVLFVVILILLAFALLPIKFAAPGWMFR
jgi:preprotein translocase subunit SecG